MAALQGPQRWAYQAYRRLPGPVHQWGEHVQRRRAEAAVRAQPDVGPGPVRLLVGPLNTAGQAQAWARAASTASEVSAQSLSATRRSAAPSMAYSTDLTLTLAMQLRGLAAHRARVLGQQGHRGVTHVLAESGRPVLGDLHTGSLLDDLPALTQAGIRSVVVLHGSELRDLHSHAEREEHSPFRGTWDERWTTLQRGVHRTRALLDVLDLPVFVSTPDLLDDLPDATLLPVVVDVAMFNAAGSAQPALRRCRPVVLHAPSNPRLKGTEAIERVLVALQDEGLVDYRRITGVRNDRMPEFLAEADIVVDQVVLGNPGVLAAETMAAGRLVVAHVANPVRDRVPGLPVLEATPDTLQEVLRDVISRPTAYQGLAARGPVWAQQHHDGREAARVLGDWMAV